MQCSIAYKAIKYHNGPKLPDPADEKPDRLLYSKLLRDADKLDVWLVVATYYAQRHKHRNTALEFELPDTPGYSLCLVEDILNHQVSNYHALKTYNDLKLLQPGWIFDINFTRTFLFVQQRQIIEKIITILLDTEDIRKIQNHLNEYLEKKDDSLSRI